MQQRSYKVYRSLDRPLSFFGIKGSFMSVLAVGASAAAVIGIIAGGVTGSNIIGLIVFLSLCVGAFMVVGLLQDKYSEKDFMKLLSSRRFPQFIRFGGRSLRSFSTWIQ